MAPRSTNRTRRTGCPARRRAWVFAVGRYRERYDRLTTILALQGVVNQDGPRLLLDTRRIGDWPEADRLWQRIYERDYGFSFGELASFDALLRRFRSSLAGVVVYDDRLDATRYVALTLAGLERLLAVPARQLARLPVRLPVKHDLRGRWKTNRQACAWAIEHLLGRCDPSVAFSAGHSHDRIDMGHDPGIVLALDYVVRRRGFVFNLSPAARPDKYPGVRIPGYPGDARLFGRIMARLTPPAAVYGWAEPEWTFTDHVTRYNHYVMCGLASNLSFHSAVPAGRGPFRQRRAANVPARVGPKHYVAFMTSEGDAPRVASFFFGGGWQNPARGQVVINWGINPVLVAQVPAMMRYYYRTATANDYFFGGVGGAGYVFVNRLPDVAAFARHGREHLERADVRVIDLWHKRRTSPRKYEIYARIARLAGITHLPSRRRYVQILPGGVPVVFADPRLHYVAGEPAQVAERIRRVARSRPVPGFLLVYKTPGAGAAEFFRQVQDELDPARFEPVRLDVMMQMIRRLHRSGRMPGPR